MIGAHRRRDDPIRWRSVAGELAGPEQPSQPPPIVLDVGLFGAGGPVRRRASTVEQVTLGNSHFPDHLVEARPLGKRKRSAHWVDWSGHG